MRNLASQERAYKILNPHFGTIKLIMNEALRDVKSALAVMSVSVNNRAKTALLHSIAIQKADIYLKDVPGIFLKKKYQSLQIVFDNALVGRFKKVNGENKCSNHRSSRNDAILGQQPTLFDDLGIMDFTFIDLGYKIDFIWEQFEKLVIVCRQNENIVWYHDFTHVEEKMVALVSAPAADVHINDEKQITLKKAK